MNISAPEIWIIIGVVALIAELLSVSFVFIFISIGAFVTALLTWTGLTPGVNGELLAFAVTTVLSLVALRKPLRNMLKPSAQTPGYTEYVGDKAVVITSIHAKGEGKVFYRGTEWIALSKREQDIDKGQTVVIRELDGIKLIVEEV